MDHALAETPERTTPAHGVTLAEAFRVWFRVALLSPMRQSCKTKKVGLVPWLVRYSNSTSRKYLFPFNWFM